MQIKYRQFKTSDSEIVAELIQNLYQEDPGGKPMSNKKIQNTFDTLLHHPDKGTIIVLENAGEIIGYAILINFWSNEFGGNILNVDELYIKKGLRGKGIGSGFIKYLIEDKFGRCVALQLEVTPGNKKARKLYESLGFKLHKNDTLTFELK